MDADDYGLRAPPDRAIPAAGRRSSGLTEGDGAASSSIIESTNSEWTDEKHSLYLNSMEELFVNQLYKHDYHLGGSNRWLLRTRKDPNVPVSNARSLYSGQFKVQRRGCWEEHTFEKGWPQTEIAHQPCNLSANPWIKHFRSPNAGYQRREKKSCGVASGSKQFATLYQGVYHQESVGCSEEVSDQNFVDESKEDKQPKKRRTRNVVADASVKDQVVPYGNSPKLPSDEACSSLKMKDSSTNCRKQKT